MTADRLPVAVAQGVADKWGLDQVIVIARDHQNNRVHVVTYGKTRQDCGMAAMDGRKLGAVIEARPTSLADALAVAERIRPGDVRTSAEDA